LPTNSILIDDRLLVAHVLNIEVDFPSGATLNTTVWWHFRACRAAVAGTGGKLSGPFRAFPRALQEGAIQSMLRLPAHVVLPEPRPLVPVMVDVAQRHPHLRLMNREATAAALLLDAAVWLSPAASRGVLPAVFDAEHIPWTEVPLE